MQRTLCNQSLSIVGVFLLSALSLNLPMFFIQLVDGPASNWFWDYPRWYDFYWYQADLICIHFILGILIVSYKMEGDFRLFSFSILTVGYFIVGGSILVIRGNGGLRWFF